jgi:hypothetical protein
VATDLSPSLLRKQKRFACSAKSFSGCEKESSFRFAFDILNTENFKFYTDKEKSKTDLKLI